MESREERWIAVARTLRIRIVVLINEVMACKLTKHAYVCTYLDTRLFSLVVSNRKRDNYKQITHAWNLTWIMVIRIKFGLNYLSVVLVLTLTIFFFTIPYVWMRHAVSGNKLLQWERRGVFHIGGFCLLCMHSCTVVAIHIESTNNSD